MSGCLISFIVNLSIINLTSLCANIRHQKIGHQTSSLCFRFNHKKHKNYTEGKQYKKGDIVYS